MPTVSPPAPAPFVRLPAGRRNRSAQRPGDTRVAKRDGPGRVFVRIAHESERRDIALRGSNEHPGALNVAHRGPCLPEAPWPVRG